jgi:hypothetical protein
MGDEGPVRWVPKAAFVMPLLPPQLEVDPVLAALLHCMAFLEVSGDDAVDPDWAVEAMEYVATYVQRLPREQLDAIEKQLARIGEYMRQLNETAPLVTFVDNFLVTCGADSRDVG